MLHKAYQCLKATSTAPLFRPHGQAARWTWGQVAGCPDGREAYGVLALKHWKLSSCRSTVTPVRCKSVQPRTAPCCSGVCRRLQRCRSVGLQPCCTVINSAANKKENQNRLQAQQPQNRMICPVWFHLGVVGDRDLHPCLFLCLLTCNLRPHPRTGE